MRGAARFKAYEEKLRELPFVPRLSFVSLDPLDEQLATRQMLSDEDNVLLKIKLVSTAVKSIVESTEEVSFLKDRSFRNGGIRVQWTEKIIDLSTEQASCLVKAFDFDPDEVRRLFPGHSFNPYFELMCIVVTKLRRVRASLLWWNVFSGDAALKLASRLRKVVKILRAKGLDAKVQQALDKWRTRMRGRTYSSRRYVDKIFALYPDLFSIRLNLNYCMQMTEDGRLLESPIGLPQAKAHLAKLDRFMRDRFPVAGHLYWREYGLMSGYNFRVLYLVNGLIKEVDHSVLPLLEEQWRKVITQGRGRHYNSHSARYRQQGGGQFHEDDARESEPSRLMNEVERHITQADFWAFHKKGGKCFGRGQEPLALFEAMQGKARKA